MDKDPCRPDDRVVPNWVPKLGQQPVLPLIGDKAADLGRNHTAFGMLTFGKSGQVKDTARPSRITSEPRRLLSD